MSLLNLFRERKSKSLDDHRRKYREIVARLDNPKSGDLEALEAATTALGIGPEQVESDAAVIAKGHELAARLGDLPALRRESADAGAACESHDAESVKIAETRRREREALEESRALAFKRVLTAESVARELRGMLAKHPGLIDLPEVLKCEDAANRRAEAQHAQEDAKRREAVEADRLKGHALMIDRLARGGAEWVAGPLPDSLRAEVAARRKELGVP